MSARVFGLVVGLLVCSCRESSGPQKSGTQASGVNAAAPVAETTYPVVFSVEPGSPLAIAGEAAVAQSIALDVECAALEMSSELTSSRPNGTGCPRDTDAIEGRAEVRE